MLDNVYFWFSSVASGEASPVAPSLLSNVYFWAGISFFSAFALTYWLLQKPATFLILMAMAFASFFLLGPLGLVGFAAGAGARMFLTEEKRKQKEELKKQKKAIRKNKR